MADITTFNGKRCTRTRWTNTSTIANSTLSAAIPALSVDPLPDQTASTLLPSSAFLSSNAFLPSSSTLSTAIAPISQASAFTAIQFSSSTLPIPTRSSVQLASPAGAASIAIPENSPPTALVPEASSTTFNVLPLPQVSTQPNELPPTSSASQTTAKSINSSLLPLPSILITGGPPASSRNIPTAAPTTIPATTEGVLSSGSSSSDANSSAGDNAGLSSVSHTHKAAIAGGVAGAIVGLAAFVFLLFICCRRRKAAQIEEKRVATNQSQWSPVSEAGFTISKNVATKLYTAMSLWRSKMKGWGNHNGENVQDENLQGLENNSDLPRLPFVQPRRRSRTRSAPPARLRLGAEGGVALVDGASNLSRDAPPRDSPRSLSDGVLYRTPNLDDPFRDPEPTLLRVTNPDSSQPSSLLSTPCQTFIDGQADHQRTLLMPIASITRGTHLQDSYQDPSPESIQNRSRRPHWLRQAFYGRSQTAWAVPPSGGSLRPPNPSFRTMNHLQQPSIYLLPRPQRSFVRSNTTPEPANHSTPAVNDAGRLQPAIPWTATTRTVKGTSDPFDLDRPEILGYESPRQGAPRGLSRSQSRASRSSNSGSRERSSRSSTPNWVFENG